MKLSILTVVVVAAVSAFAQGAAAAGTPVAYPMRGQSAAQQRADDAHCREWASNQVRNSPQPATAAAPTGGGAVGGEARGALGGAIIGGVVRRPGRGAAIGATAGALSGGRRSREAHGAAQQNQAAAQSDQLARAVSACMSGRGYSVR